MKKLGNFIVTAAYLVMCVLVFYYADGGFFLGSFGVEYKYLLSIGIFMLAVLVFLITADLRRAIHCMQDALAMMRPYVWILGYSLLVWVLSGTGARVMIKGTFYVVYQIIGILAAAGTLYLFGTKGIRMLTLSLLGALIIKSIGLVQQYGLGEYLNQYITNIITFTENSGTIVRSFEKKGYCYPVAFLLVYYLMTCKKNKSNIPWIVICFFMLFLSLKRSVFLGSTVGIGCGWLLSRVKEPRKLINGIAFALIAMTMLYVILVYYNLFDWMEAHGISTSGRDYLYNAMRQYYYISPAYIGKGVGYVSMSFVNGDIYIERDGFVFGDVHNTYLRQYIDCGFIGYLVWLWLYVASRGKYFFGKGKTPEEIRHGVLSFAMVIINCVLFMTEDTLYFYYATIAMATVVMGDQFEKFTKETKLPGE